jgi:hypothetical protein
MVSPQVKNIGQWSEIRLDKTFETVLTIRYLSHFYEFKTFHIPASHKLFIKKVWHTTILARRKIYSFKAPKCFPLASQMFLHSFSKSSHNFVANIYTSIFRSKKFELLWSHPNIILSTLLRATNMKPII